MANMLQPSERAKSGLHNLKVVILAWKTKNVLGSQKSLKMKNWQHYSMSKRPEYATRHEAIIFHHDNAWPHVAIPVKNYLENSGWEVSPHPPYSPDLAPSDYHLFRSMQNAFTGIRLTSEQGIKNWIHSFLAARPAQFFWDGIYKLPERWEKVIASDGKYFK